MSEAIHLQVYRRFFAVLFSVIPGVNIMVGMAALMIWIFADLIELDWGVGIGFGAVTFVALGIMWVFVGLMVQKWAEQKGTGLLVGLCTPFLIVDGIVLAWLFWDAVLADHSEEASETAMTLIQTLSMLG